MPYIYGIQANKRFYWPYDFSLVKIYRISSLIGYTVFLTSAKIVLSFCSQHGRRVGEGAKTLFDFYVKKKK